jgi:ribosomal protein S18 acetylase RimI-like enzyme
MRLLPVNIEIEDYMIKNIDIKDLPKVLVCVNQDEESIKSLGRGNEFTIEDIKQRYMETLVSTLDFFCGIYYKKDLIGILKGRIENKNIRELWILSYILLKEYRNNEIGSSILSEFEKYFFYSFSIDSIFVLTTENNLRGQKFWIKNQYEKKRIINNMMDNGNTNMIVFGKEL